VEGVLEEVMEPDPVLVLVRLLVTVDDPVCDSVCVFDDVTVGDWLGDQTLTVAV